MLNFVVSETKICFPLAAMSPVGMCATNALNLYSGHAQFETVGYPDRPCTYYHLLSRRKYWESEIT